MIMFNQKEFEEKIYFLVINEVNHTFSKLFSSSNKDELVGKAVKINRQIMQVLHYVIEEIVTQNLYGLLMAQDEKSLKL